jgi:hypothetical protein
VKLWIVGVVLLAGGIAHAGDSIDSVFNRLALVDRFAFGETGYAGVISPGEKDYKLILARPSALADFERLFSVGNSQAKSYALVGIRKLSPSRFEEVSRLLRDSKEKVLTQSGCIVFHKTLGAVLEQIVAGRY